ncbi:hypothetical protein [Streptomyces sp. NPDC007007]|uniref:hypothetical protein n=1 Tax=Streptomyces sp. NPDC007007 TaxID=3364770 RepID=UPI00368C3786
MGYKDEDEIKQELGIETWRHLSKDKMMKFVAMMPDMETEVALRIVDQFPTFRDFAKDALDAITKAHDSTLSANTQSQEHVHRALQEEREALKSELNRDDLNREERMEILNRIQENSKRALQNDSDNKKFLSGALNKKLGFVFAVAALAVAFVGGRVAIEGKERSDGS